MARAYPPQGGSEQMVAVDPNEILTPELIEKINGVTLGEIGAVIGERIAAEIIAAQAAKSATLPSRELLFEELQILQAMASKGRRAAFTINRIARLTYLNAHAASAFIESLRAFGCIEAHSGGERGSRTTYTLTNLGRSSAA